MVQIILGMSLTDKKGNHSFLSGTMDVNGSIPSIEEIERKIREENNLEKVELKSIKYKGK